MAGAAELVHEEEDVAAVHADAALEVWLEHHVAGHRLPVAVEGQSDELAVGVEDRAAGVAAGDVVGGEETAREVAVGHSVLSVVSLDIELLEFLSNDELIVVRILFLDYAGEGRIVLVHDTVSRGVALHGTIGQTHCRVCVRIRRLALFLIETT